MIAINTKTFLAALMVYGFTVRANAGDIKDWSLVCTRHVIGRIAALSKAGDRSEAYALSQAAGDLCGDPIPGGAGSFFAFGNPDDEFVSLSISAKPPSKFSVSDRWTPRWNLTTGKGEIAARREAHEKVREMLSDDWAKHCREVHAHTTPELLSLCLARPKN
jgi:hypothetical protein